MARARNIKPTFFTDGELTDLEPLARLLFAGLWCIADKKGRLKDKPKDIKLQILPADDCDIDRLLNTLADHFITRYEVAGRKYIQINNFGKHQNPHKNEAESGIPGPNPEISGSIEKLRDCSSNYMSNRADSLNSDSFNLIPDSLTPPPPSPGECACSPIAEPEFDRIRPGDCTPAPELPPDPGYFPCFWTDYPKKCSLDAALRAWKKLNPDAALAEAILSGLEKARASPGWQREGGRFIPYPANWLKAGGWKDDFDAEKARESWRNDRRRNDRRRNNTDRGASPRNTFFRTDEDEKPKSPWTDFLLTLNEDEEDESATGPQADLLLSVNGDAYA